MYGVELAGGKGNNVVVSIMIVVVDESKCGTRFDIGTVDVITSVKVDIGVEDVVVEMRCGMRLVVVVVDVVGGRNVELEGC